MCVYTRVRDTLNFKIHAEKTTIVLHEPRFNYGFNLEKFHDYHQWDPSKREFNIFSKRRRRRRNNKGDDDRQVDDLLSVRRAD